MITETGIDFAGNPQTDGWRAQGISEAEYVAGLAMADEDWRNDGILLATPFIWEDYNWPSFTMTQAVTRPYVDHIRAVGNGGNDNPSPPLPEDEAATDAGTLCEKARWWMEEWTREHERGNLARAEDIQYSLIKLLYRAEDAAKEAGC